MKRVSMFLLAVAGMGLAATSASAVNLLTDPGFELQTTAPNPNPNGTPGWATFGGAGDSNAAVPAHTGSWVMYMNGTPGGYYVPGAYEALAATAGQTYTLSGWFYTPSALVTGSNDFAILQMSFDTGSPPNDYANGAGNAGDSTLATDGINVGTPAGGGGVALPQGVWTFASVTGTAPAGTNSMGAYLLNINADSNAVFAFDDISLTVAPEPASVGLLAIGGLAVLRRKR